MALVKPLFLDADCFRQEMAATDELELGGLTMSGNIVMGGNEITGIALTPTLPDSVPSKQYVDNLVNGLDWKESVRLATDAALPANTAAGSGVGKTLTADANGALTVDGVAVAIGDRILVKDEITAADNGIYVVTATGDAGNPYVLTRAEDADEDSEVTANLTAFVEEGTVNADTLYTMVSNDPIVVDTNDQNFGLAATVAALTYAAGLLQTGNNIDVELDTAADAQGTGADGGSSGLEFDITGAAGKLRVKVDPDGGIQRSADGIELELDPAGALSVGAAGAAVNVDGTSIQIVGNQLVAAGASESQRIENSFTAQAAINACDPVYATTTNNEVAQAQATSDANTKRVIGVAVAAATPASSVDVISEGLMVGGITGKGFTAGDIIYLADGGGLTNTKPSAGSRVMIIGRAVSADDMMVKLDWLGRRAV